MLVLLIVLVFFFPFANGDDPLPTMPPKLDFKEEWGYYTVRPKAHSFWWLYYKETPANRPLIMWLQGGPGVSGVGFGNFEEIGPLNRHLQPRNHTWLLKADLIFVDNPVGTGFSYVDSNDSLTTDVHQIANDLLTLSQMFFDGHPQYQTRPFYVFSESYGGKMTVAFASILYPAMKAGKVLCNFKGVVLGDSWISPIDYILSWGPFLYYTSLLDDDSLRKVNQQANICKKEADIGHWYQSTICWENTQLLIQNLADDVSWYNILKKGSTDPWSLLTVSPKLNPKAQETGPWSFHLPDRWTEAMAKVMNGPVRKHLGTIPKGIQWRDIALEVFQSQYTDFNKPVIEEVDYLLANTTLKVAIYEGQLDLICNTVGTDMWLKKLKWVGLAEFQQQNRQPLHLSDVHAGFFKTYRNLMYLWIFRAGHMVPADSPEVSLKMVDMILGSDSV